MQYSRNIRIKTNRGNKRMAIGSTLTPVGMSTDKNHIHNQYSTSTEWVIVHPLNKIPSITCYDTVGDVLYGIVDILDYNTIKVTFSFPFKGKAILN